MAVMTNMQALVLPDGQATPVNHTFSPASNGADGVARWQDREHNSGVSIGFSVATFSVREPVKAGGPTRVRMTVHVPKLDTTGTVPVLVSTGWAQLEYLFPGNFTLQDRKDLRAYISGMNNPLGLGDNAAEMSKPY